MGLPEADNHRRSLSGDAPRNAATNADVGHATCHRHGLDHGSGNRPSGSYKGEFMSHIMPPRVRFAKAQLLTWAVRCCGSWMRSSRPPNQTLHLTRPATSLSESPPNQALQQTGGA